MHKEVCGVLQALGTVATTKDYFIDCIEIPLRIVRLHESKASLNATNVLELLGGRACYFSKHVNSKYICHFIVANQLNIWKT